MKKILITLLSLQCSITYAQKDGVVIEDRLLTWKDFKGKPTTDVYKAKTYTYMSYKIRTEAGKIIVTTECLFDPKMSWVSKEYIKKAGEENSVYLLNHEQRHYDITRVVGEELEDAMQTFKFDTKKAKYQVDSIFRSFIKKDRDIQKQYDDETEHSKVREQQEIWDKKIDGWLKKKKVEL